MNGVTIKKDIDISYCCFNCILRVNVRIIQSGAEQGPVDLADFHIYCSVFHADSRSAIRFS